MAERFLKSPLGPWLTAVAFLHGWWWWGGARIPLVLASGVGAEVTLIPG